MIRSYADQMREHQVDLDIYQRRLAASGYGPADRERFLAEHGDREKAELVWEEEILPAAEASGELPLVPQAPLSPREQAEQVARTQTYREMSDDPTYDVWAPETPQSLARRQQRIEGLTEELLPQFEQAEAHLVEAEAQRAGCVTVEIDDNEPELDL